VQHEGHPRRARRPSRVRRRLHTDQLEHPYRRFEAEGVHDASSGGMRTLAAARSARVLVSALVSAVMGALVSAVMGALVSAVMGALVSVLVSALGLGVGACAALACGHGRRGRGGGRRLEPRRLGGVGDPPEIMPEILSEIGSCLRRLGGVGGDRHGQPGRAGAGVGHVGLHQ